MPQSHSSVSPQAGSFVACHVFGVIKHVGIWVDNAIVELQGTGLIRVVSPERFLKDRSGTTIYISCIQNRSILNKALAQKALDQVFQFRNYDLLKNNCYRFCFSSLTGHEEFIETFSEFNQMISNHYGEKVEWKPINI
ncbi:hypothetical protein SOPP22_05475 [Shewanella sp. OPT22]|nr:hypothetical protein SOPP22_05475 [Shewanella sp. OPT22]